MAVTINGTTGIAGVDGSASTPAVQGTDTNTGIFFPAADTIGFAEGGAEAMRIDSSGNVLVNTTTGYGKFTVQSNAGTGKVLLDNYVSVPTTENVMSIYADASRGYIQSYNNGYKDIAICASGGNVGIGTSSPTSGSVLDVASGTTTYPRVRSTIGSAAAVFFQNSETGTTTSDGMYVGITGAEEGVIWNNENTDLRIATNNTERARITSGGVFCFGKTSDSTTTAGSAIGTNGVANFVASTASPSDGPQIQVVNIASSVANGYRFYSFRINSGATEVGSITTNGSNATSYVTSSDYRLKENVAPMTGALSKIAQLKPSTWTWKNGGTNGQGFIAHELAEVCPDAVVGEKDAVEIYTDEEGNEQTRPRYQGVDTSFLVATLTAAIQELKAELDAAKARIAVLEAK